MTKEEVYQYKRIGYEALDKSMFFNVKAVKRTENRLCPSKWTRTAN